MAIREEENLIYGHRLSSVGPAKVTGSDVVHEPTAMDLAFKLHYIRGVYYFTNQAVGDLTAMKIKDSMFFWLNHGYETCGRFRRPESGGRPYIKCNDCGARFIEAKCGRTLDEWVEMMKEDVSLHKFLVSDQVIGPLLTFSPTVLIQVTWFKCGGMSMGFSFAHVLGDAFSISDFINIWGRVLAGHDPHPFPNIEKPCSLLKTSINPHPHVKEPVSVMRVDPVGDHWIVAKNCNLAMHSFIVTAAQLSEMQGKISGPKQKDRIPPFESLCTIFWKCIAHIRDGPKPNRITVICKNNSPTNNKLSNSQIVSVIEANFDVTEVGLKELAALFVIRATDERKLIEEAVEKDVGASDFVVYGANLTLVNWEEATFYGLELYGQKPILVNYTIDGIGDGGAVLVLPGPNNQERIVMTILPENEILQLKSLMRREWSIA